MNQRPRIAFVGAGKQAQSAHLRHYATLPDCEICAIADKDAALASRVAQQFNIPKSYDDHHKLLSDVKPDAVVVTLPAIPSAETVICDILKAGVPLITEKPIAGSPKGSERILEAAKRTGTLMRVAFHKRSDPATMAAVQEIDRLKATGELGKMTYVRIHASLAGDWIANAYRGTLTGTATFAQEPKNPADFPNMSEVAQNKFGGFSGAYGHQFDWMRSLLGESYHIEHVDPTGVLLAVKSASGVPAVFECTPYKSKKDWVENALVCFEKGYIRIDLPSPLAIHVPGTVEFFRDESQEAAAFRKIPVFPRECAMNMQAKNFLAELRGEKTGLCDAVQAYEANMIAAEWARKLYP